MVLRSSDAGVIERAESADALPVINGGSQDDHPTQALTDLYTLYRELGKVDGINIAVVGRLEHRNVSALLKSLALFKDVTVTLIPFSGHLDPEVMAYCESMASSSLPRKESRPSEMWTPFISTAPAPWLTSSY